MKSAKTNCFLLMVFISIIISVRCGEMKDHSETPDTINISGVVNNGEIPDGNVAMKNLKNNETFSTKSDTKGNWMISIAREKIVSGDTFLLSATNPENNMTIRSVISADDIISAGNSFSSDETAISNYTEAAYLIAQADKKSDIAGYLKQTIRSTDSGLPASTGDDPIDALALWINARFKNTEDFDETNYTLDLLGAMISYNWPTVFISGSDSSVTLPANILSEGVSVSVSDYEALENLSVDGETIKIGAEASESVETGIHSVDTMKKSATPTDPSDNITVKGESIKIITGSSFGRNQAKLILGKGDTQIELALPVNILTGTKEVSNKVSVKTATSVEIGSLVLELPETAFSEDTVIHITELDMESFEENNIADLTIEAGYYFIADARMNGPVKVLYQHKGTSSPENMVLVNVNGATKSEVYVYPDSYDEVNQQLTFSAEGLATFFVGIKKEDTSGTGTEITASTLMNDSEATFSFVRLALDKLNNQNNLDAIKNVNDNGALCSDYMLLLSSKALSSFMALPVSDKTGLAMLKEKNFSYSWYSLSEKNAYDEYFLLRSQLMQILYKITNSTFEGLNWWVLVADLSEGGEDPDSSVLGQPDESASYYFPMIAYRLLNLGCTSPDDFFESAGNIIGNTDNDLAELEKQYQKIIDWVSSYIEYKLFTSPKVPADGLSDKELKQLRDDFILKARSFINDPMNSNFAGIWLGGAYRYSEKNDIDPANEGFAEFNDTLSELPEIIKSDSELTRQVMNTDTYPLGSSVTGRKWVSQGDYYIPAEVDDEITVLENWLGYFKGLTPGVTTWYKDADGDGYGDPNDSVEKSAQPDGYVADNTDPDDSQNTIYPGAPEICGDELDNDRNGETDEGCGSTYKGTETTFSLLRKGFNQYLIPVEVGNQTLNLLVDTGSNALLIFKDKLSSDSTVEISDQRIRKSYVSTVREGYLATAPVRIGGYYDPDMKIMVITSPDSDNDPSLTAKKADGIIGFRRTQGLEFSTDAEVLDVPLNELSPAINIFELNLPPSGIASLSLGKMSILDRSKSSYVFKAKTFTFEDPMKPFSLSYADLQVPFRAKSRYGEANEGELDVLLDSGAVSKLVLDTEVAKSLGYDPSTESWSIPEDDEIEFSLVGPRETIPLYPKFKISEISVAPFQQMGVTYEAVLGIDRWQHYVVGFSFVDFQSEGPDGTLLMLFRPNMAEAFQENLPGKVLNYQKLPGLNSIGDDRFPTADDIGDTIAIQSNRLGGKGGWDVYIWKKGLGIIDAPNLNSEKDDGDPSLTGDGRYMVFHSIRTGDWNIYMYDLTDQILIDLPGLNTDSLERTPTISRDGRYIVFRSEREGGEGSSDIYLYDRNTAKLIDLPGLNSDQGEYDPVVNGDGSMIAFDHADESNGGYNPESFLYNVSTKTLNRMEAINTSGWEMDTVVSPDGNYFTFQANYNHPEMELYDRDFYIYNIETSTFEIFSGLNSNFDEEGLCFTGNSRCMLFHSNRSGGEGGSDVYFYNIDDNTPSEEDASSEDLPVEKIILNYHETANVFTINTVTSDGEELTLLLEMGLEGILLFEDKAPAGISCGGPKTIQLPCGTINVAEQVCINFEIANLKLSATVPLVETQSVFNTLTGRTDLPVVDGVIGFRGKFANDFSPVISQLEFCTIQGKNQNLNDNIVPGLTIGSLPMISAARGQGQYLFESVVYGYTDTVNPFSGSYTNMDPPFVARTDQKKSSEGLNQILLSSVLKDTLILDYSIAQDLGYTGVKGWGTVKTVSIYFVNDEFLLPIDLGAYPVKNIIVKDLGGLECQAVLSSDRWIGQIFLGYQIWDYQSGGPYGTISLLHVKDLYALQGSFYETGKNYVPLPGLNSLSDDLYPTISLDGQVIAFQSNRGGNNDVYVYRLGYGILDLPGINSPGDEGAPYISGDGNYVTFHSDKSGNYNIYLYDILNETFIDLPELNTDYLERTPAMSADGKMLTFRSERPESIEAGSDIFLYNLEANKMVELTQSWLNTQGFEYYSFLNEDGTLLSFCSEDRDDIIGGADVFLYNLSQNKLEKLPSNVNTDDYEYGALGPNGKYMAISTYYDVANSYLLELESGEYIYLPGLNTTYNDGDPVLSANAQFIAFDSDRPGGKGGWDIYLYQRDETDTSTYTVTTEYEQEGYVIDSDGNSAGNEEVSAYDKKGTLLGTATTDGDGNFTLTIPLGTQLPITYETETENLVVVTDDVGDDTYVPDFEAGNLKFTKVWIEDKAEAGLTSQMNFNIEASMPNNNIYITVYLKEGNPSEVTVDENFTADFELTSLVIDRLGFRGNDADPVSTKQKDTLTQITYLPGTENRKAYVEHTFVVPQGIPDGLYTAVFAINTYDVTSEDDAIQGEDAADLADNFMVSSAATIIGNPDKPNLRILSSELYTNSFELPESRPSMEWVPEYYDLSLNLEVESMAQDTDLPVDIIFELDVNGTKYPLTISESDGYGGVKKMEKQTYEVGCRDEDRPGYPEGDRCASLFRQEQTGKTYSIYLNEDAYDALENIEEDTVCSLIITVDPKKTVEEYEDNLVDNILTMPVMFLAPEPEVTTSALRDGTKIFDLTQEDFYGDSDRNFGIGYKVGPSMYYKSSSFKGMTIPYAVNFDATNTLYVVVFGDQVDILVVGPSFDFDCETSAKVEASYFDYGVDVLGFRIWGQKYTIGNHLDDGEYVFWDTTDDEGNEEYAISKEKKKQKTFNAGIPITVMGGVRGELGIRGEIKYKHLNKLVLEAGPYCAIVGMAEAGVGVPGFSVGVGIELLIMDLSLKATPSIQILPDFPVVLLEFKAPIVFSTLDGEAYVFARAFLFELRETIIDWSGYTYEINFFPPLYKGYGAVDLYKSKYYATTDWTGTYVEGSYDGILYHSWGDGGPSELTNITDNFSAEFYGYFEFPGWDSYTWGDSSSQFTGKYTFFAEGDDKLEVTIEDGDEEKTVITTTYSEGLQSVDLDVSTGFHKVTAKVTETIGGAGAKLYWTKPNQFACFYYEDWDMTKDPVFFESTEMLNFNWGLNSPKPNVVPADYFSAKYQGTFNFPETTTYRFIAKADDYIQVYVDGYLIIDSLTTQAKYGVHASVTMPAGEHTITIFYFHTVYGAYINLAWGAQESFIGAYYNNRTFKGSPVGTQMDGEYIKSDPGLWDKHFFADFEKNGDFWKSVPSGMPADNWSVMWEGCFEFKGGEYDFAFWADDEISIFIDNRFIGTTTWDNAKLVTQTITPGWHTVRIQMIEHSSYSYASLKWGLKKKNIITEYYTDHSDNIKAINRRGPNEDGKYLDYNWGNGGPEDPERTLGGDWFKVVSEGNFDFDGAPYMFSVGGDDHVELYIDNVKVMEGYWSDWRVYYYEAIAMNKGVHTIKTVMREDKGGAWMRASWEKIEPEKFYGLRFDDKVSDYKERVKLDGHKIDYEWGADNIYLTTKDKQYWDFTMIQWVGVFTFDKDATYKFHGSVDDNIDLYIDGKHMDRKTCCGDYTFEHALKKGTHTIRAVYWDDEGNAALHFDW